MSGPEQLLQRMVDRLARGGPIRSPEIEKAFRQVPRHHFLADIPLAQVYRDQNVTTKEEGGVRLSSSTAPWVMASMLEQLQPRPGQRILEVGTGTGYNAAILARLVTDSGQILTVDVDDEVVQGAVRGLARAGHDGENAPPGAARVEARASDGFLGDAAGAPWDGILVTVRTATIPRAWVQQIAIGGRLVVPFALRSVRHGQLSVAFEVRKDHLTSTSFVDCDFILPRGEMSMVGRDLQLLETAGLLWSDAGGPHSADQILEHFERPPTRLPTSIQVAVRELIEDFQMWLVAHDPNSFSLVARGECLAWDKLTPMVERPGLFRGTGGLFDGRGLAMLGFVPADSERSGAEVPRELVIIAHGDPGCAERLRHHLHRWHQAGRPGRSRMRMRIFVPGRAPSPEPTHGGVLVREPWGDVCVDWPAPR